MRVLARWDSGKDGWDVTHRYSSWDHFIRLARAGRWRFNIQAHLDGTIYWRKVFPLSILSSSVFRFDWEGDKAGAETECLAAMRVLMGGEL